MAHELSPQRAADHETVMHELVLSQHVNQLGTLFGGMMMSWVDICGAITAQRYTHGEVVTAAVDSMDFLAPPRLGDVVRLKSRVTWTGNSSLEVRVIADILNHVHRTETRATECYITFVAVDESGKPRRICPLALDSEKERLDFEGGKQRKEQRIANRRQREEQLRLLREAEAKLSRN